MCVPNIWCMSPYCIHPNSEFRCFFDELGNVEIHSSFDSFCMPLLNLSPSSPRRRTTMISWLIVNESLFMEYGKFYLMMNLLMHIAMASWSNVMMESFTEYFRTFSHTWQIIQKSRFSFGSMATHEAKAQSFLEYFWLQFEIRVAAHVPDAWFPRPSFIVLAFSLMFHNDYQKFVSTFENELQPRTMPSTNMVPQLREHFPSCSLKPFHWYLLLYVVHSQYPQILMVLSLLQEHIYWYAWTPGIQHLSCAYGRSTTQVWARNFQISIQTPFMATSCN